MKLIDKLAEDYNAKRTRWDLHEGKIDCAVLIDLLPQINVAKKTAYKAGMEKMRELVLEKSAGWFTEKQGDRLTSAEWQEFMKMVQQLANEEVEGGKEV